MSELLGQITITNGHVIQVRKGDLTEEAVDAIVNPANEQLANGGGVAGAISRTIGPCFQEACWIHVEDNGPLEMGSDTMIYDVPEGIPVPFKHVISVVGPRITKVVDEEDDLDEEEPEVTEEDCDLLYSAVMNLLEDAMERGFETVSIPAISSGIFGFPKNQCAVLLFEAAVRVLKDLEVREKAGGVVVTELREIRFTNFDQPTCDIFLAEMNSLNLGE